jgi:hypothetical protein
MPLGKYHCDYCDKQFQDTPYARKRHLQGLHHLRAKALWFDSLNLQGLRFLFSFFFLLLSYQPNINIFGPVIYDAKLFLIADANQAYTEGFGKGVCNRFVKTVSSSKSLNELQFSLFTQVVLFYIE